MLNIVRFTMDELLTNIMIYWTTNSVTSSIRYYKENYSFTDLDNQHSMYGLMTFAAISHSFLDTQRMYLMEWPYFQMSL